MNTASRISKLAAPVWALAVAALCACTSTTSSETSQLDGLTHREESPRTPVTEVIGGLEQEVRAQRSEAAKPRTGGDGYCGVGEMEHEQRQHELHEYFKSAQWKPQLVPPGCTGKPAPQPTMEARPVPDALASAEPELLNCMRLPGVSSTLPKGFFGSELPLALEIDRSTGCVVRTAARVQPLNETLDKCVAQALSRSFFEPGRPDAQLFYWIRERGPGYNEPQARLIGPQQLAPVASRCAERSSPTVEPLTGKELSLAFQAAKPGVERCMEKESVRAHTEIAINAHGPTGRVVGAAAVANPRLPALDACLADVFAAICFVPFEAPEATRPYWSSRYPFFAGTPQHYEHFAEVESTCVAHEQSQDATGPSLDDVADAVRPALPAVRACYAEHGFQLTARQWVDIAIDGETGGIGKAAAAYTPRRPTLDACIAGTLRDVCFKPFRGIRDSYNSLLRRSVFSFSK